MNNFEIATIVLTEIFCDEKNFSVAVKSNIQRYEVSKDSAPLISGIVGCELRHHMLLLALAKETFSFPELKDYFPLLLLLTNVLFYKRFENDQLIQNVCKVSDIKPAELNAFIADITSRSDLLPKNVEKGSPYYLSIRFNTPLWLVNMWIKHYGRNFAYKILKDNYKPSLNVVSVNTIKEKVDAIIENKDFALSPVEGALIYSGKMPIRKLPFYTKHLIYQDKLPFRAICNNLDIEPHSTVAIFSGYSNNFYLDLATKLGNKYKGDIIVPNYQDFCDVKNNVKLFGLENVRVYEAQANTLITCISEKVDLFCLLARNSNFELFKTSPDYFLRFSRDSLDKLITEQRYSLEEAAELVNVNGILLYMIPTLNKKEGRDLIKDFLLIHPNFKLLEEKQYFPFDPEDSILYFAKLLNTGKND